MSESSNTGTDPTSSAGLSEGIKDHKVIIIPSVIGGSVLLLLTAFLLWSLLRRRHRRMRNTPSDDFRKDMMVLTRVDPTPPGSHSRNERARVMTEGGKKPELDLISSTTPLQEGFDEGQDDRSSFTGSVYSRTSAGTQTLAASGISGKSEAHFEEGSEIPIPPLIPIPSSSYPPPSPLHLRTPSRARTDRQMQIEQKIIELQGRFITASGSGQEKVRTRAELKDRIERVKELRESAWAYGGKGDVPDDLID
ncbi:hypothetical protein PQX77_016725 [Marasmius sp. AFHP31]|nr:hypothetical protein PQX77_016725 [Marasmius sp. AFHP31]